MTMRETTQIDDLVDRRDDQAHLQRSAARIVGTSAWALSVPARVAALAATSAPMLLEGERGSGKEFLARLIHETGPRNRRPFVALPTDVLDERVLQAVLFATPESLTFAIRELRAELGERVRGGTLYVSDVSGLAPEVRRRVMQAVETPDRDDAGRPGPLAHSCRLAFGATAPISGRANALDYTAILRIPPLRERAEDVPALAALFVESACHRFGREPRVLSDAVLAALGAHTWPGNVSELKQTLETVIRGSGPPAVTAAHLPASFGIDPSQSDGHSVGEGIDLHAEVQRFERSLLRAALARCGGVQTKAATLLGLKVSTLNSKLANYNIDASAFKARNPSRVRSVETR